MSDAILLLRLEHDILSRVLDLIEDHVERLEMGAPIDEPLLHVAVAYLTGFPDECHHPKEDLVFRKLAEHDPTAAQGLPDLAWEHERLARETDRFTQDIHDALSAARANQAVHTESLRKYVHSYRQHMQDEERNFFPAALSSLTRDHLAELDHTLFDRADPIFDPSAEARFAKLREEIERRSSGSALGSGADPSGGEFALLRSIRGIEQFNDAMDRSGFCLVEHRAGGFTLKHYGRWVLDIPECDPGRAAWSAYYFVKGMSSRIPSGS